MSYEIVYGRSFVKCNHGIIPIVLTGSNNCSMWHGGRWIRERNWSPFYGRTAEGHIAWTAQELMDKTMSYIPSAYQQHFMYHSKWVDDKAFVSFIENGIKKAATLEEICENNIVQDLTCSITYYDKEDKRTETLMSIARTTEELDKWIDEAEQRIAELTADGYKPIFANTKFWGIKPLKTPREATKSAVMAKYESRYITKIDKTGSIQSCKEPTDAIVFENEAIAREMLPTWTLHRIRFVSAESVQKRKAAKQYYITANGMFVRKVSSRHLFYTWGVENAQKFTMSEANAWIAKHANRAWERPVKFEIHKLEAA